MTTKIIQGWLKLIPNQEDEDILCVVMDLVSVESKLYSGIWVDPEDYSIAEIASNYIREHGKRMSVRYWISNVQLLSVDMAQEEFLRTLYALDARAEYEVKYSETTGYLWTDENFWVGGHDMITELTTSEGKFLLMELTFNE